MDVTRRGDATGPGRLKHPLSGFSYYFVCSTLQVLRRHANRDVLSATLSHIVNDLEFYNVSLLCVCIIIMAFNPAVVAGRVGALF